MSPHSAPATIASGIFASRESRLALEQQADHIAVITIGSYFCRFNWQIRALNCLWTPPIYTLTGICSVEYIKRVESVFEIIAEPNRRAILSLLVSSQQSVGEIERRLHMPQPAVSKHLRVLREAGFVESTVDAQRRLYRLRPEPLQEIDAWLSQFRRFWSAHLDALERHLDRMHPSTPSQTKKTTQPKLRTDKG